MVQIKDTKDMGIKDRTTARRHLRVDGILVKVPLPQINTVLKRVILTVRHPHRRQVLHNTAHTINTDPLATSTLLLISTAKREGSRPKHPKSRRLLARHRQLGIHMVRDTRKAHINNTLRVPRRPFNLRRCKRLMNNSLTDRALRQGNLLMVRLRTDNPRRLRDRMDNLLPLNLVTVKHLHLPLSTDNLCLRKDSMANLPHLKRRMDNRTHPKHLIKEAIRRGKERSMRPNTSKCNLYLY